MRAITVPIALAYETRSIFLRIYLILIAIGGETSDKKKNQTMLVKRR
jgi:hypothetical protein